MTAAIGVGVVGTGFGQKVHIPGLQAHHRTQVVAVYHRDLAQAQAVAAAHNIPVACDSVDALVQHPEVAAVAVSTPPFLHYPMAQTVLKGGKHLLLEKPATLTADEALHLAQLASQRQVAGVMDFEFRFVPAWMRLQELLAEGYVGQPRLVKVDWMVPGRANPSRPWNWYAQKELGGGALGAFASHTFDYLHWLFGPVQRLCAQLSTAIPRRPDANGTPQPVDADDTCNLILEFADGTPAQVAISSVTYGGRGHWLEVYGDRGTLILGSPNLTDYVHGFTLQGAPAGEALQDLEIPARLAFPTTYADGRIAPFVRVVDHWVRCIEAGATTAPSLVEGAYAQRLMDVAHQSHREGRFVSCLG